MAMCTPIYVLLLLLSSVKLFLQHSGLQKAATFSFSQITVQVWRTCALSMTSPWCYRVNVIFAITEDS